MKNSKSETRSPKQRTKGLKRANNATSVGLRQLGRLLAQKSQRLTKPTDPKVHSDEVSGLGLFPEP